MSTKVTPLDNLDFFEIRDSLKEYLQNQDQFLDYDFEGSNISTLVDLLAYNAFYNSYYYNMAISENFLDSATQRNSVVSHAKELNYLPRSRRSSTAVMNIFFTSPDTSSNILTIPANTPFNGKCGNQIFTFLTDKAYSAVRVDANSTQFYVENVVAYEGRNVGEIITVENSSLSNAFIDTNSLRVTVNGETFTYRSDIFGVQTLDKVFYLQAEPDGKYSIQFGENTFGVQPKNTDTINAFYRITSGEQANGVTSLTLVEGSLGNITANVTLQAKTSAGAYAEDIESIRKFAPRSLQVQERAVTKRDYETILKQRFNNIQAISVYGGDEVDPPQYGKAIISVDVTGAQGASDTELATYRNFLSSKTPLTIEPVFVQAKFMYVNSVINVTYRPSVTDKSSPALRQAIIDRIVQYNTANLNDFNVALRQSSLSAFIDATDPSILGTDIVSKPIIEYVPSIGSFQNPSFSFNTQLTVPYALDTTKGFNNYNSAVTTTVFTLEGTEVRLIDNGVGEMIAVTADQGSRSVFKREVGTIDYTTGRIALSNLKVDAFRGDAIQFIATTQNKDIVSPKDRILIIREQDLTVTVTPNTV